MINSDTLHFRKNNVHFRKFSKPTYIFVNAPPLPLLCEISGALHLAQPGLTAGWLAGRRNPINFRKFQNSL